MLFASLAGCAHYRDEPITAQQSLASFEARRCDGPELTRFLREGLGVAAWPPPSWDLDALTLVAFYYSPEMDVARARWRTAEAGLVTAGARPDPDATAALGYNSTSTDVTPWIPEAVLDFTIETAGKRGIRVAQAGRIAEAARLDALTAAWQVRRRLRAAYLDLFIAQRREALFAGQRDLLAENVRLLEIQLEAGEISPNELTQARIAADRARLESLDAARRSTDARIRLAGAVGVPAPAIDDVAIAFTGLESPGGELPSDEARRRALVNRSDVLRALAEYDASQSALQLEIAKQYPDFQLGPGFQRDQTDSKWTLAVGFTLPVFSRNRGPIAEAEARREEMAARVLAVQARVLAEVEQAEAAYRAAAERVAATDDLFARLQRREAVTATARRLGEVSPLDLLSVRIELAAGELTRLEALEAAQRAAAGLEDAIQSPLVLPDWVLRKPARKPAEATGT